MLYECAAAALCPKLRIRAAKVEDFDDLVPIFDRQGDVLRQQYGAGLKHSAHRRRFGTFFLNDIIAGQNSSNRAFVVDDHGTARG